MTEEYTVDDVIEELKSSVVSGNFKLDREAELIDEYFTRIKYIDIDDDSKVINEYIGGVVKHLVRYADEKVRLEKDLKMLKRYEYKRDNHD